MTFQVFQGDCTQILKTISSETVQTCVTSPPYWQLKDYGVEGQIGAEETPEQYAEKLGEVFDEVRRILTKDGTLWLNLGDVYCGHSLGYSPNSPSNLAGSKQSRGKRNAVKVNARRMPPGYKCKDLVGAPWLVAFELRRRGWYLRCDVIWDKRGAMPEKVKDRPTRSHEYVFLLSKSQNYFCNMEEIMEPSVTGGKRNRRTIWSIPKQNCPEAHFAVFPDRLVELCISSSSRPGDTVIDPFAGSGTTGRVSSKLCRNFLGIELNPEYCQIAEAQNSPPQLF